jgi:hypothetical protein
MPTDLGKQRIVVLSDNKGLSKAVEINLTSRLKVEVINVSRPASGLQDPSCEDCDLIIVALSSPCSEPVVALARASLAGTIGHVPLLIISDRPFQPDPADQIAHLDFPFDIETLQLRVSEILNARFELAPSEAVVSPAG